MTMSVRSAREDLRERVEKAVEKKVYSLLQLQKAPKLFLFKPSKNSPGLFEMENSGISDQEYEQYYVNQPLRGVIADRALLALSRTATPYGFTSRTVRGVNRLGRRVAAKYLLSQSRTLTFKSWYVNNKNNGEVEGYLELPGKFIYPLTIVTPEYLRLMSKDIWSHEEKDVYALKYFSEDTIVVPGKILSESLISEALTRWYRQHVGYSYRHWSKKLGLPTIKVDLEWELTAAKLSSKDHTRPE